MPDTSEDRVSELRQRIEDRDYRVDAQAVAKAIVERLLSGRSGEVLVAPKRP